MKQIAFILVLLVSMFYAGTASAQNKAAAYRTDETAWIPNILHAPEDEGGGERLFSEPFYWDFEIKDGQYVAFDYVFFVFESDYVSIYLDDEKTSRAQLGGLSGPYKGTSIYKNGLFGPATFKLTDIPAGKHTLKFVYCREGARFNVTRQLAISNLVVTSGNIQTINIDATKAEDGVFRFIKSDTPTEKIPIPDKDAQGRCWFEEDYDDSAWQNSSEMGDERMCSYNMRVKFNVGTPSADGTYCIEMIPSTRFTDVCRYYVNGNNIKPEYKKVNDYYGHTLRIPAAALHEGDNVFAIAWQGSYGNAYEGPQIKIYANNMNFDAEAQAELQQTFENSELVQAHAAQLAEAQSVWNAAKTSLNGKDELPVSKLSFLRELINERCRMAELLPQMPEGKEKDALQAAYNEITPSFDNDYATIRQQLQDAKTVQAIAYVTKQDMEDFTLDDKTSTYLFSMDNYQYTIYANERKAMLYVGDGDEEVINIPEVIFFEGEAYVVSELQVGRDNWGMHTHAREINFPDHLATLSISSIPNITSLVIPEYVKEIKYLGGQNVYSFWKELKEVTILGSECRLSNIVLRNGRLNLPNMMAPAASQTESLGAVDRTIIHVPEGALHAYAIHPAFNGSVVVEGEKGKVIHTGTVSPGELGFIVLTEVETLREVNGLIVDGGDFDDNDWRIVSEMPSLISLDMSGSSIKEIPSYQFNERWAIKEYKLPQGLQRIGERAFSKTPIKNIELPASLTEIQDGAFQECKELESIVIPDQVTRIGSYAFASCSLLQQATLSKNLEQLEYGAFSECDLHNIELPSTIAEVGSSAFSDNHNLTSVTFNEGQKIINDRAFAVCNIKRLDFPTSLEIVKSDAFRNNDSLAVINFQEGLLELHSGAFGGTKALTSIVLPNSLQECQGTPFADCENLQIVDCHAVAPANTGWYGNCPVSGCDMQKAVLRAPEWGLANYKLAKGWSQFMNFESNGTMPQHILLNQDFHLVLSGDKTENYHPNITLYRTDYQVEGPDGKYIQGVGTLTVSNRSILNANSMKLQFTPSTAANPEKWNRGNSLIVNGEMRAEETELTMMFRMNEWNFFCVPFDVRVSDIIKPKANIDYVIRAHNGEAHGRGDHPNGWRRLTEDDILTPGTGYIISYFDPTPAYGEDMHKFVMKPLASSANRQAMYRSDDRTHAIGQYPGEFAHNINWNFLGNPYPSYYDSRFLDIDAPIVVWDYNNRVYRAYSLTDDNYILVPGEAFFVQAPLNVTEATFAKEGRQLHYIARNMDPSARRAPSASKRTLINLRLQHDGQGDQTRIVLNETAQTTFEMGRDAGKIRSTEASAAQLFTLQGNTEMAINERPMADGSVRLGVICPKAGRYTISLQESDMQLTLADLQTGTRHLLTADTPYEFTANSKGTFTSRFTLILNSSTDAIDAVTESNTDQNERYDLQGRKMTQPMQKGITVTKGKKYITK